MTTKNPWLGLASYEEPKNDGNDFLFCGRDEETIDMVRLIDNNLFITLYGSSGVGKTSLLRAGVIPILRRKDYFPLYVRLSQEPKEISYAEAIVRKLQNSGLTEECGVAMRHPDGDDRLYLWNYFATTRFLNEGREVYPVIIFDQFEEVFREGDKAKAELLLKQIYLLLNNELEMPDETGYSADTNYRFVASIREDFLFVLEDSIDENSLELYKNNRYRLRPMKPEQAKQVVLVPGKDCIEESEKEDVANQIILLSQHNKENTIDTLLLSLICCNTFERKTNEKLSLADFAFWGNNPMRIYYQEAIRPLHTEHIRYLQQNLIEKDGSRKRVQKQILITSLGANTCTQLLEGPYKILTLTSDGQVELLHDQLALAFFEDRDAYEERERNWKLMEMRSRFVAEKAVKLTDEGKAFFAQLLIINVLPQQLKKPNIPYTFETEYALRKAYNYRFVIIESSANTASFSPDCKHILSASSIWDKENGQLVRYLLGHKYNVNSSIYSPDGKLIASASEDGTVRIWDNDTGKELRTLIGHTHSVNSIAFSPNGNLLVSASWDNTIKIWDTNTGQEICSLTGHSYVVNSAVFSHNGKYIASASSDKTIKVWDAETGLELYTIEGHSDSVNSVVFSPDDKLLLSASWDNTVKLWDVKNGQEIRVLRGHSGPVNHASFSPDGLCIVSSSRDNTLIIWDTEFGYEISTLKGHTDWVKHAVFSPDGKQIVSVSKDGTLRIWNLKHCVLEGHANRVNSVAFCPNGKLIVTASDAIRIWNTSLEIPIKTLKLFKRETQNYYAVSNPDGTMIASISSDNTVRIWDAASGQNILKISHYNSINSIAFSPDGKMIASVSSDNIVRIWDTKSGQNLVKLNHSDSVYSVDFSPDGKKIASASWDNTVKIWDVESKLNILTFNHLNHVNSVAFSPDGKIIASACSDSKVRIWDATSGRILLKLNHSDSVNSVIFSPDGRLIASASWDNTVKIWDTASGRNILTLNHSDNVNSIAFSPDGKTIASVDGWDNTVKIWDISTGEILKTIGDFYDYEYLEREILNAGDEPSYLEFSDNLAKKHSFPTFQDLINQTRERFIDRPLTDEERRMYYLE